MGQGGDMDVEAKTASSEQDSQSPPHCCTVVTLLLYSGKELNKNY